MKYYILLITALVFTIILLSRASAAPLTVLPSNPRYFTDGSGKAIYLSAAYGDNFQNWGPGEALDFDAYLDFLEAYNHNFIRLWVTDTAFANGAYLEPQPFVRTGPGNALDGKPKFDLTRLNQNYFDELRSRVVAAQARGIYISIMLFDTWGVGGYNNYEEWSGCPFNQANNINGINGDPNGDGKGIEVHTLKIPAITSIQESYVRKVIDTVNDQDNVLYEIMNEGGDTGILEWENYFADFIRQYEAGKPKRHPVGITACMEPGMSESNANAALFASHADWISPFGFGSNAAYAVNPPASDGTKVVFADSDHIELPRDTTDPYIPSIWVWKSFLRGLNPIHLVSLGSLIYGGTDKPGTERALKALGSTLTYANRMNLASMTPQNSLSSTSYCLANPGQEYLAYQPGSGSFSVNLQAGTYSYEWFSPSTGSVAGTGTITVSAGSRPFTPPFSGDAVLYLKAGSAEPYCGDGSCNGQETCSICPGDCGQCPSQGPVAWWKLDETSGTIAFDSSGNGNNGTCAGSKCPSCNSSGGKLGGACVFSSSQSINVLHSSTLSITTQLTLSAWVKTKESAAGGAVKAIIWKGDSTSISPNWGNMYRLIQEGDKASVLVVNSGRNVFAAGYEKSINDGEWHHLAGVFDSQTNTLKMYVDGVQDGSTETTSGTLLTSTQPVSIGSAEPNYVSTEYFNGTIDDVRIYSRALSSQEILSLYQSGSCIHESDSDCSGCVSISELNTYIGSWYTNSSDVTLKELMEAIGFWKRGGCP